MTVTSDRDLFFADFDFGTLEPGQALAVWLQPVVDRRTGLMVQPPALFTGVFDGIDHPREWLPPWMVMTLSTGAVAGFPLDDVAQVQLH